MEQQPPVNEVIESISLTFYEISLQNEGPLTGSLTYERADLREALDEVQRQSVRIKGVHIEAKMNRDEVLKLLARIAESTEPWIDLKLRMAASSPSHDRPEISFIQ